MVPIKDYIKITWRGYKQTPMKCIWGIAVQQRGCTGEYIGYTEYLSKQQAKQSVATKSSYTSS